MISKVSIVVLYSSWIGAMQSWDAVVSLDYQVKYHLKKLDIPAQDSPFDCIDASVESVMRMLRDRCEGFLERKSVRLPHDEYVFDTRYEVMLSGPLLDIPFIIDIVDVKQWLRNEDPDSTGFAKIKAIHGERISQLLALLNSDKRVLFIRKDMTKQEALKLDAVLQESYPKLVYTILALGENGGYIDDWGLDRIRSFYILPLGYSLWCGNVSAWKKAFEAFGLISPSDDESQ